MSVLFWITVILGTFAVAGWMARPFLARRGAAPSRVAHDMSVYKAQLDEVSRDAARGAISTEEAEAARREIGRRLLDADREATETDEVTAAPAGAGKIAALAAALVVLFAGLGVYLMTGAPSQPDQPLALRDIAGEKRALQLLQDRLHAQAPPDRANDNPPANVPANFPELVQRMESILKTRRDDAEGHAVLGRAYLRLERPRAAYPMLQRSAVILGERTPPDIWLDIGRAMVTAAGGYVSQEAEAAFHKAPDIVLSQVLIGQAEAARGELEDAIGRWAGLYPQVEDPQLAAALIAQIKSVAEALELNSEAVVAQLEGERNQALGLQSAPEAPGPTREDMDAAADMSEGDRAEMIEGMVAQLAGKLEENPNDIGGWTRLLRAYQVLGREDAALDAFATAAKTFEGDADAVETLRGALAPELRSRAGADE